MPAFQTTTGRLISMRELSPKSRMPLQSSIQFMSSHNNPNTTLQSNKIRYGHSHKQTAEKRFENEVLDRLTMSMERDPTKGLSIVQVNLNEKQLKMS